MARKWMAGLVFFKVGALRPVLLTAAAVAAMGLPACGASSSGGGAGGATAGKAGDPCNPATQNQGCLTGLRMQCQTDATSGLGGKWQLAGPCGVGETCVESTDPSSATKRIATCKASSTGADATSGSDGTTSGDTTSTGPDGTVAGSDTIIGGDDTIATKDTGPALGSCGDGYCNTGETAANCPADCGTAPVCNNNGTCDPGETKANCPADCTTVSPKCNNNGTCDPGETTANCPADCPAAAAGCGDLVCTPPETATSCPIDCDPANLCLNQNCASQWSTCLNDAKCNAFLQCLNPCATTDQACVQACVTKAGNATVTMFSAVQTCYKNAGCGSTTTGTCGDGTCNANETKTSCPADCGGTTTGGNPCDAACGGQASIGCYCDAVCMTNGDCCGDAAGTAAKTCTGSTCATCNGGGGTTTPVCGNGKCETGETNATCPADCPASTGTCTTYADVQSILKNNCNGCHGHQFGNSCAATSGHDIAGYVAAGAMPTNKTLSAADKAKIAAWAAANNACTTAQCP